MWDVRRSAYPGIAHTYTKTSISYERRQAFKQRFSYTSCYNTYCFVYFELGVMSATLDSPPNLAER